MDCFFLGSTVEQRLECLFEFLVQFLIRSACIGDSGVSEVVGLEGALHSFGGVFAVEAWDAVAVEFGDLVAEDEVVDAGRSCGLHDRVAEECEVTEELAAVCVAQVIGGGDDDFGKEHAAAGDGIGLIFAEDGVS